VLVDQTQPADALLVLQAELLRSVHLPTLVGLSRPSGLCGRAAARCCRRLLLLTQPALQGAFAGYLAQSQASESHADVTSSPTGMLLTHRHNPVVECLAALATAGTGSIGGVDSLGLLAEATNQISHRSRAQMQGVGDGGHILMEPHPLKDGLANRQGNRGSHGDPRGAKSEGDRKLIDSSVYPAQPFCRY